jgi:hypothetical protein
MLCCSAASNNNGIADDGAALLDAPLLDDESTDIALYSGVVV